MGPPNASPPLPRGTTRASAWTHVAHTTCPRHLRLAWARVTLPRGLACRVASPRVSLATSASLRATSACGPAEINPLFLRFKIDKKITFTQHPIAHLVSYEHLSSTYHTFALAVSFESLPQTYHEALQVPEWKAWI